MIHGFVDSVPPTLPLPSTALVETPEVLRQLARAHRQIAELKGVAGTIPNESILFDTRALQEAKDSSEIENIVTTQMSFFRAMSSPPSSPPSPPRKSTATQPP